MFNNRLTLEAAYLQQLQAQLLPEQEQELQELHILNSSLDLLIGLK